MSQICKYLTQICKYLTQIYTNLAQICKSGETAGQLLASIEARVQGRAGCWQVGGQLGGQAARWLGWWLGWIWPRVGAGGLVKYRGLVTEAGGWLAAGW